MVGEIADHARQPAAQVVDSLDTVRDAAAWFRPLTAIIGAVLAARRPPGLLVAAPTIATIWLRRPRSCVRSLPG